MATPDLEKILAEMDKLTSQHEEAPDNTTFLITGESGTGKTHLVGTAPGPIHMDNFDPLGYQTIEGEIEKGRLFVEDFSSDDPKNPQAYNRWEKAYMSRKAMGYYGAIGTYVIESLTTFSDAIMLRTLKAQGRPGGVPQQNDYLPVMTTLQNALRDIATLPCNVIVTAHLDMKEDQITGQMLMRAMLIGKLVVRIPLLFSEIYVAEGKATSKGTEYSLLTSSTGRYVARTRIGKGGLFEARETPNIAMLLKKAGKPWEDKDLRKKEE